MRIEDCIDKSTRDKLNKMRRVKQERTTQKDSRKKELSSREIEDLMGVSRPTYKRCNGAFRQI